MVELAKANPDAETLKLVVWAAVGLIAILLAVIGYLLKMKFDVAEKEKENEKSERKQEKSKLEDEINRIFTLQTSQMDKLSAVVDAVSETVNNLKTVVAVIKEQQDERDPRTEKRLNAHANRLDEHDKRITQVETTCKMNHS